jgi:exopolyphosphatase/guanosine-5'-triphosphate,3'-diphosphate pyrophosphatase
LKVAALDLGSNTFLCLIAEVQAGRIIRVDADESKVVRLGEKITETNFIQPQALDRARDCFSEFRKLIDARTVDQIFAMATSAARSAKNSEDFLNLAKEFGFSVEIISGQREAEITFLGAFEKVSDEPRLVIDIGGGSTEFGFGSLGRLTDRISVELGCVRIFESWGVRNLMPQSELSHFVNKLREIFSERLKPLSQVISQTKEPLKALAVAGTPVELGKVVLGTSDIRSIHGKAIDLKQLGLVVQKILKLSADQLTKKFGVMSGRADVLLSGAIILQTALEVLGLQRIEVSTRGLRHGIALAAVSSK